jgi:hypothetical protein
MSNDSKRSHWLRGAFASAGACLVLLSPFAPLAPEAAPAASLSEGAVVLQASAAYRTGATYQTGAAHQARTVSLRESGNLHLTSRHGFTLNEQGTGTGTISGTIYVHLKIVSTSKVAAEMNIYLKGGSISGNATAGYRREGATGRFAGSLSIARGTGSYAHAQGSGLGFSGTIRRSDYAVTVHVSGTVTD